MFPYTIYSRKSLEDKDSQVQSIPDQESVMESLAHKAGLVVTKPFLSEAKSAKAPGRIVFGQMMKQVEQGDIRGILCWKLDRLARNPVDGGRIIWAIKQHGLVVRTPYQTFSKAEDNLILMYIEFGMAQKYVDDLSLVTTRGLESKAIKGWLPGLARVGYLNSKVEERGKKTILCDPDRFAAVRRMFDLMLTGNYNPTNIQKIANHEWGFRTRQAKKSGGKPLSRSTIYKMFSDPFYYGRFEYPRGSGQWYQGQHTPMITEAEFNLVQKLLHQKTNPRPQTVFALPLRGLLKCGGCDSSITAHVKEQVRCTACRYKSSVKNQGACSKCGLSISEMKGPKIRRYGYYHCTRTLNAQCRQKCVSANALENQLTAKLKAFGLPLELRDWGLEYIEKLRQNDLNEKQQILAERKKAYDQCVIRLANLVRLKTAPENADSSLLSDEEYQNQRTDLVAQRNKLGNDNSAFEKELIEKAIRIGEALKVVGEIAGLASSDDAFRKKEILSALGSNHVLNEKKLEIKPEFPFCDLPPVRKPDQGYFTPIEPENIQELQRRNVLFEPACPRKEQKSDEDRTKLKIALDIIWKKNDSWAQLSRKIAAWKALEGRHPRRGKRGRFEPASRLPDHLKETKTNLSV